MAIEILNDSAIAHQCKELAVLVTRYTDGKGDGFHRTDIDKLEFARESSVSASLHEVSEAIAIRACFKTL